MMARTHSVSSVAGWLGGCWLAGKVGAPVDPGTVALGAGAVTYTSMLPDVDHHSSTISRSPWTMPLRWLFVAARAVVWVFSRRAAREWFAHRRITHSLAFAAVAGAAVYPLGQALAQWVPAAAHLGLFVAAGSLGHTLGDCLTNSGCPLLAPLSWRRFRVPLFSTDSGAEAWVVVPLFSVAAAWLGWQLLTAAV